jgi:hypothetical protein
MAVPATKEQALRNMRVMWFAFIMSVVLYIYMGLTLKPSFSWMSFKNAGTIFAVLSALYFFGFLWAWWKFYRPAVQLIRTNPTDVHAVGRLMVAWIMLLAGAEAEILFGFIFWMGNKTLVQSLPFFVLGSLMLLSLWPRQVWSPAEAAQ